MDNLPVVWRAHAHRHGEVLFIGTPLVHHYPGRFAKQQFQTRNLSVPQVMVEDRRQIHPALPIGLREQVKPGLAELEFRDQLLVFLEGALGIRQGELGALRWLECDFDNMSISAQHSY
jgi:integrase